MAMTVKPDELELLNAAIQAVENTEGMIFMGIFPSTSNRLWIAEVGLDDLKEESIVHEADPSLFTATSDIPHVAVYKAMTKAQNFLQLLDSLTPNV